GRGSGERREVLKLNYDLTFATRRAPRRMLRCFFAAEALEALRGRFVKSARFIVDKFCIYGKIFTVNHGT
ncbi:MAG: hypothetical protein LUI02_07200, partial [Clostridiales bacterium]|nr:hypothetical protein [Clostridiales bacterium]